MKLVTAVPSFSAARMAALLVAVAFGQLPVVRAGDKTVNLLRQFYRANGISIITTTLYRASVGLLILGGIEGDSFH